MTLGLASCYCAEACDLGDSGNSGGGGGGNAQAAPQPQMSGAGGFVPQPQPSYQPQNMDWTPVQSEAQDPIQAPPIDDS